MQQKAPDITISTVYWVLDQFCKAGLISRLSNPNGKSYFDITRSEHHHIYSDDNAIMDYEDPGLTELVMKYIRGKISDGIEVEKISIQIFTKSK